MSVSVLLFKDKIIPVRETERESNHAGVGLKGDDDPNKGNRK